MWVAVAPVPVSPSPKSHAYPVRVPSGSLDPEPSTDTVSPSACAVTTACGGTFGVVPEPSWKCCFTWAGVSATG